MTRTDREIMSHKGRGCRRVAVAWFLLAVLLSSGCTAPKPLPLGFAGGLTGKNSAVAVSARDAILLAVEEVNQKGGLLGRPVALLIQDDYDTEEGTAAADAALIREGVPVIFGHYMSQVAEAAMRATEGQDVLLMSPTVSTGALTGQDDQFLRVIVENTEQGRAMAETALSKGGGKAVLVYNDSNQQFVQGVAGSFREAFVQSGGAIVAERMIRERDAEAMTAILQEIRNQEADTVMMVLSSGDVAMFAQLLSRQDLQVDLYSSTWGMTADVIREGGAAVEGISFPALFNPEGTTPEYQRFRAAYREAYSTDPDFAAVYAYEAARVVFAAIGSGGSAKPSEIKAEILRRAEFQGLQGPIVFDAYGDVERAQFIVTVRDGRFVTQER